MRFVVAESTTWLMALYAKIIEVASHGKTTVEEQNFAQLTMANNRPAIMFRSFDSARYAWVYWGRPDEGFVVIYATENQLDNTVAYPAPGVTSTHKEIHTSMDDVLRSMNNYITKGKLNAVKTS